MQAGGVKMLVLEFPTKRQRFRWGGSNGDPEKRYREAMDKLNEIWDRAELYDRISSEYEADPSGKTEPEYVPEMDAIRPVLTGERKLMIKVDAEKDILAALDWVEERGLDNVVFSGVAEGWRVADRLAEAGIPVITGPVLATPTRASDRYDKAYANAGLMHDAGVKVALRTGEAENVRNLAFNAGFAAAYGMGREAALRAVTETPAEIFGIADEYGSIEVGKKANLVIADGDPFETDTNIMGVFIDGFNVPMTSRQIELYEEFLNRDEGRVQPVEIVPADQ
jgi:imidazolonepropionase-like amidohydrolase